MKAETILNQRNEKFESLAAQHPNMTPKLLYETPVIEVIEVEVEKGFAASLTDYSDETA